MHRLRIATFWAAIALVLYVASLGPALFIQERIGLLPAGALDTFYAPIGCVSALPFLSPVLKGYLRLWIANDDCGGTGDGG